jgi:hypothetical protein
MPEQCWQNSLHIFCNSALLCNVPKRQIEHQTLGSYCEHLHSAKNSSSFSPPADWGRVRTRFRWFCASAKGHANNVHDVGSKCSLNSKGISRYIKIYKCVCVCVHVRLYKFLAFITFQCYVHSFSV